MNMENLRNMVIGMRYQNGMDIDLDNMTYQELLELEEKMGSVSKGLSEDQIQKLCKRIHNEKEPEQLCSVCYYNAKDGEELTILPCNHSFHSECIKEWLIKEKMCPMCKQEIITKIQSSKKLLISSESQPQSAESIFQQIDFVDSSEKIQGLDEQEETKKQMLQMSIEA